jgi:hypothetical protein
VAELVWHDDFRRVVEGIQGQETSRHPAMRCWIMQSCATEIPRFVPKEAGREGAKIDALAASRNPETMRAYIVLCETFFTTV